MLSIPVALVLATTVVFAEVPSYIKVCGRRNPNLDQCVIDSVNALRDKLKEGIPELDVPSAEPLVVDKVIFSDTNEFKAVAEPVELRGLTSFNLKTVHVDLEKKQIDLTADFDSIKLDAIYDVHAKILVNFVGKGPIKINVEGVDIKVTLNYELVDHKGKQYVYFPTMSLKLNVKDFKSVFTPPPGTDKTLAESINTVMSTNRQEVLKTINPNLEKAISERVLQVANMICKKFTFDELFPDRE
ncbi:uncharacterized protein LOC105696955 [Orussus abietinus]|uniref:uncharacterized protein LOC105696955 n=1 Tax=Orussus abietinus TaxID=222816 RepID=UPI0006265C6E|nr:uncharacterized protein LOC105696955 [Orussus abietinus]